MALCQTSIAKPFNPANHPQALLDGDQTLWMGRFQAMASDCEVLMEGLSQSQALELLTRITQETWRIEAKYSRYREDSVVTAINSSGGQEIELDPETSALIDFADHCFQLSDGKFDITSGVLRKVWRFDGGKGVPNADAINPLLRVVGWSRVKWCSPRLCLPKGMEIDLGGLGKEYAVDRALLLAVQMQVSVSQSSYVINFGGDIACTGLRLNRQPWRIGVESANRESDTAATLELGSGAVATSGDARRYVMYKGKRLPHILNPLTGWPVEGAPHAVSVAADSCMQAGLLSTLAMLHGDQAEAFLDAQDLKYWVQR